MTVPSRDTASAPCLPATSLPGIQVLAHTTVRDADGRLEVYARAVGDALYSRTQGYPGGPFLPAWTPLGVKVTSPPAAALDAAGRLVLFARSGDGSLWSARKTEPNGNRLGGWVSLAGWIDAPVVVRDHEQRLTVSGIGSDSRVWATTQRHAASSQWLPWVCVTDRVASRPVLIAPPGGPLSLIVRNGAGLVEVYALGEASWQRTTTIAGAIDGAPAAVVTSTGRLTVLARGPNHGICQAVETAAGSWSTWQQLGYHPALGRDKKGNPIYGGDPLPFRNGDGRLEVIVRAGEDKDLWRAHEAVPGYAWSEWSPLGVLSTLPAPTADVAEDGRVSLFYRDPSLTLSYSAQTRPGIW
jgi:hypothetical protein